MTSKPSLYSVPQASPPLKKRKMGPLASNATFTSTLSSLLASSSTTTSAPSRPASRPQKTQKPSIFTTYKSTKKRALANDADGPTPQKHSTTSQAVDEGTLHHSKRKMEEKARLYASMKRGDYAPRAGGRDKESEGLVDFDRKWADTQDSGNGRDDDTSSDDYASSSDGGEVVEFEDEFGRMRKGTKKDVAKLERERKAAAYAKDELEAMSARPERPSHLIVGDTVQHAAFNPDEPIAVSMAQLAAKRDRSLTPPPEVYYDASKEVRSKGVGFYQFSKDAGEREREMKDLERERKETERRQKEKEEKKARVQREREVRKRMVAEKRGKMRADRFLEELDIEIVPEKAQS